jgi:hypothetical protein
MHPNCKDLTGKRFGRLLVLYRAPDHVSPSGNRFVAWTCICDCRKTTTILAGNLRKGFTTSCGCLHKERTSLISRTHGESKTSVEYDAWTGLINRCYCKTTSRYRDYGERGISVCPEWRHSYESFLADMGRKPSPRHSIDRINNDGDYEPSNCRWATPSQQAFNRRKRAA